jgi:hypothetical protein
MDFNNEDARTNLVEMFRAAAGKPEGMTLATAAFDRLLDAEAAAARFSAAEAVASAFFSAGEALDAANAGSVDSDPQKP